MEDGDTEKYHPSSVIQEFVVFSSQKSSCIRCISLQVYNKNLYHGFWPIKGDDLVTIL